MARRTTGAAITTILEVPEERNRSSSNGGDQRELECGIEKFLDYNEAPDEEKPSVPAGPRRSTLNEATGFFDFAPRDRTHSHSRCRASMHACSCTRACADGPMAACFCINHDYVNVSVAGGELN